MKEPNIEELEELARGFLTGLGLDLENDNFKDTPYRFTRTYINLCRGLYKKSQSKIKESLGKIFPTNYKGMVIQEPIRVYSLCSHHMLPITYDILFGYIPMVKTLGFSNTVNTTSAVRGVFKDEERTRNEFLKLASFRNG